MGWREPAVENMVTRTDLDHVLDHTRDLWDELRGKRLFITGGTGFFGSWLLDTFTHANERLCLNASALVLTRGQHANRPGISFHIGDIRTFEFPDGEFPFIIHAALDSSVLVSSDCGRNFFDTIVAGTHRVLDFARHHKTEKFLFTSSGAVYGKMPDGVTHITEDYVGAPDPLDIHSAYGEGKRLAEHLCVQHTQSGDMQVKIARCFAFVGPYLPLRSNLATRLSTGYAIGNFIQDAIAGGPIRINGDGKTCRAYLYAADLAIWLWTILFRGESCVPYNVGSEDAISIIDLASRVNSCFSEPMEIQIAGKPNGGASVYYVPSTQRAQRELGLRQEIDLTEAIRRTIQWHAS